LKGMDHQVRGDLVILVDVRPAARRPWAFPLRPSVSRICARRAVDPSPMRPRTRSLDSERERRSFLKPCDSPLLLLSGKHALVVM
jgi:hypothetical protein